MASALARRGRGGEIDEAFGFSLSKPLLARADEIKRLAAEVEAERLHMRRMKERLTICRRDVIKLIETALEEGAQGDWLSVQEEYRAVFADYPRKPSPEAVTTALGEIEFLRENILNQLENQLKTTKASGNAAENERHKQNSNPDSLIEFELRLEETRGGDPDSLNQNDVVPPVKEIKSAPPGIGQGGNAGSKRLQGESVAGFGQKPFPLGMVLSACREICDYGPGRHNH